MGGFDLIIRRDEEDTEAAEVFVDGAIGTNRYRFLLDTGAGRTCVAFDDYTSAFGRVGSHDSSGVFAKGSADLITVPGIELGPISKRNLTVARLPERSAGTGNLIGMDILKDYCCHFLFDEHRVLVNPSDAVRAGYTFQDLRYDKAYHPHIDVRFGHRVARAAWDTGAGITVVDLSFVDKHAAFFEEVGRSWGTDSTGSRLETPMFTMAGVVIGGTEFPPHKVAGVDMSWVNSTIEVPMDLILGYSTLSRANWLFDFPRMRWAITRFVGAG